MELGDAQVEAAAQVLYGKTFSMYSPHRIAKEMLEAALPLIETQLREQIAGEIHSIGAIALGVYTDDYQDGLRHATLTALTGDKKHPSRYTSEEREQMFGLLNAVARVRVVRGTTNQERTEQ